MKRNIVHQFESFLFQCIDRYSFVSMDCVETLISSLAQSVRSSGYDPDVVIGIRGSGTYPADAIAGHFGVRSRTLKIRHYPVIFAGHEIDDIVGLYRVARLLGYMTMQAPD